MNYFYSISLITRAKIGQRKSIYYDKSRLSRISALALTLLSIFCTYVNEDQVIIWGMLLIIRYLLVSNGYLIVAVSLRDVEL